jgi:hypothetical protein
MAVAACLALVALALPGASATAEKPLKKVKAVIPQNSVFVLNWMGANEAGVFRKHGIELQLDVRTFAGFLAGLPYMVAIANN